MNYLYYSLVTLGIIFTSNSVMSQTVTELLRSGNNSEKLNLVIIGDGFTADDQNAYDNFVNDTVIRGLFNEVTSDVYREIMNAFNVFRVNANSAQSGITTVDANGNVTNNVNTFFDYRFSGMWNRCWMEPGPNTNATLTNTLNNLVPGWDYAFIILNTTSFGGCRRGNTLAITMGSTWDTAAHEMGHMVGNLGDEYTGTNNYTGVEPSNANLTINTNRNTLKWRQFVPSSTAIPTNAGTFAGDAANDVGLFAGATISSMSYDTGIYRPTVNGRMNSNTPDFGPVCYDQMRKATNAQHEYEYRNVYKGKFTSDNRDDIMLHNANSIALYIGNESQLNTAWVRTLPDPIWDSYRKGDRFYVGDFDGDSIDDLFVVNMTDWSMPYFGMLRNVGGSFEGCRRFDRDLPGWGEMKSHDEFYVADFNGDGKDDIVVLNTNDFSIGYLLLLQSTGNDLKFVRRYDEELPGWDDMLKNDKLFVADFNNDNKDDLYIFNGRDWSVGYLGMLKSNGSGYTMEKRYDEELPGWDDMKPHDQFFVADFNNDGKDDLYIFNGQDWSMSYLQMLQSTGKNMNSSIRFDRNVPGWGEMRKNDLWYVANFNGDKRDDLYVYNAFDWSTEYLGMLGSTGSNLSGSFQCDWIGSWNLGRYDNLIVANFDGGENWDDLIIYNQPNINISWFGLLQSRRNSLTLSAIYPQFIHNYNFHDMGWW